MSRILLIDPATPQQLLLREKTDRLRRWRYTPHLGLQVLAGVSEAHDIHIVDERVEAFDPRTATADLVGVTARTGLAPRVHELAAIFHGRGIPVIVGGAYPTLSPQLALADPHVSSVVSGRAEGLWNQIVADHGAGRLQRHYAGHPAAGLPRPRRDLPVGDYRPGFALVQVTQGCNFRCKFCVIPAMHDKQFVVPEVDHALEDIAALDASMLFLVDDNLIGNIPFARRLFEGMKGLGKKFICQATLNVALDRELLRLMRSAGCRMINVGFESLASSRLWAQQDKRQNSVIQYGEAIRRVHEEGIMMSGGFIFGFDEDGLDVFDHTLEFMNTSRLDFAACHVLTPYPGTPVYKQFEDEGRILSRDLGLYNTYEVVYKPRQMSPEQLQEGFRRVVSEFWSWRGMVRRSWTALTDVDPVSSIASAFTSFVTRNNLSQGLPTHA